MTRLLPNLLCIGAPKCGTSWLARMLGSHPDIYIPEQKELNVLHYDDCEQRLDEYARYFAEVGSVPLRGDFSVRYLASGNAPANAQKFLTGVKILCVVRDPVAQVTSHYWHLVRQNFHQPAPLEPVPTLKEAAARFPDLLVEPALYHKHLQRWLERFPRDDMFVFDYDRLDEPDRLFSEIQDFLGVPRVALLDQAVTDAEARKGVSPRPGMPGRIYPYLYSWVTRGPYRWLKKAAGVQAADRLKRRLGLAALGQRLFFAPGYPLPDPGTVDAISALVAQDQSDFDPSLLRT